jgi:hypothetical protein
MVEHESEEFPGWVDNGHGTLTFSVTIGGTEIRLATVTHDPEADLYETFVGPGFSDANQLGRIDASRERAVRKAEDFLIDRLQRLLLSPRILVADLEGSTSSSGGHRASLLQDIRCHYGRVNIVTLVTFSSS